MKIVVACDHGGFTYKQEVIKHLKSLNHEVVDVGTYSLQSCHYPIFANKASKMLSNKEVDRAILICTSGEGVMMCANKFKGVRCGLAYNDEVASLIRKHNDANAIAFGEKFMKLEDVIKRVDIFLNTPFEGGRHQIRVDLIGKIE